MQGEYQGTAQLLSPHAICIVVKSNESQSITNPSTHSRGSVFDPSNVGKLGTVSAYDDLSASIPRVHTQGDITTPRPNMPLFACTLPSPFRRLKDLSRHVMIYPIVLPSDWRINVIVTVSLCSVECKRFFVPPPAHQMLKNIPMKIKSTHISTAKVRPIASLVLIEHPSHAL
jgi:hypothetical protein